MFAKIAYALLIVFVLAGIVEYVRIKRKRRSSYKEYMKSVRERKNG